MQTIQVNAELISAAKAYRVLKVNYFPHQMAIKLTEKGFLEKNQKS